eukprot:5650689-Lingulodinium_polyedra.AAC.1
MIVCHPVLDTLHDPLQGTRIGVLLPIVDGLAQRLPALLAQHLEPPSGNRALAMQLRHVPA